MKKTLKIIILFLLVSVISIADKWIMPSSKVIYSQNGLFSLEIYPTQIPENYYKDIEKRKKRPNKYLDKPMSDTIVACHAILYRNGDTFMDNEVIWKRNLINSVSPIEVVVTNDANYVLTFDDWYNAGYGDNVMVVYGKEGDLLAKYSLSQITTFEIENLSESVTSIWWYQGIETYSKDPDRITILIKDENYNIEKRIYNLNELKFE